MWGMWGILCGACGARKFDVGHVGQRDDKVFSDAQFGTRFYKKKFITALTALALIVMHGLLHFSYNKLDRRSRLDLTGFSDLFDVFWYFSALCY